MTTHAKKTPEVLDIPTMPEVSVVRLTGDLDVTGISGAEELLAGLIGHKKKHIILDMSRVTLVSSAALGKLLGIKRRFLEKGGNIVMAAMSLELQLKFALMGANKIFSIYNDIRSATNAYAWEVKHETEYVRVSFPSQMNVVPAVRGFVSRLMTSKGYSDRDSFRIETIVDEICNNAVEYGSLHDHSNITLRLKVDWDKVEIDAENVSDPEKKELLMLHMKNLQHDMSFDNNEKRGRGLALVKMLASELSADITEKGTTVHVTKIKEE